MGAVNSESATTRRTPDTADLASPAWQRDTHENGALQAVPGYVTDVLTDRVLAFVERERDRPFFVFLSHKAIHPDARQLDDGAVDQRYPMVYIPALWHLLPETRALGLPYVEITTDADNIASRRVIEANGGQ